MSDDKIKQMTVREALEKAVGTYYTLDRLAPRIEAALRAAYNRGMRDKEILLDRHPDYKENISGRGIIAGIEELIR